MPNKEYVIATYRDGESDDAYAPYGQVRDFFHYTGQEAILSGPFDTGKTFGMLQKLVGLLWTFPNAQALLIRGTYSSLLTSAWITLTTKVLPFHPEHPDSPISLYGGGAPKHLTWPNGSVLRIAGLDDPQKVLSSEYDYIAIPQAEEIPIGDWEHILSRVNGRAGNVPWPQLMGDCNPDIPKHWIVNRPSVELFVTTHEDNPTIYLRDKQGELVRDANGAAKMTAGGKGRIKTLTSMTGLRYQRGFLGLWVGAEGTVYDTFDKRIHVIDRFPIPPDWTKYRVIDFGFTHPFVCQWWAEDEDGRLYMYREIYYSERTVQRHAKGLNVDSEARIRGIIDYTADEEISATICDWDAEDRATLAENGIPSVRADKRVKVGVEKVQERLAVQDDGRPRLMIFRDCTVEIDDKLEMEFLPTSTVDEMPGYVWLKVSNKIEAAKDESPRKKDDHGMDAMRYLVMHKDGGKGGVVKVHRYA